MPGSALHIANFLTMCYFCCRWDPVFEAEETGLTYAEMDKTQKNLLSHRFRSLDKLRTYLCKTP